MWAKRKKIYIYIYHFFLVPETRTYSHLMYVQLPQDHDILYKNKPAALCVEHDGNEVLSLPSGIASSARWLALFRFV